MRKVVKRGTKQFCSGFHKSLKTGQCSHYTGGTGKYLSSCWNNCNYEEKKKERGA